MGYETQPQQGLGHRVRTNAHVGKSVLAASDPFDLPVRTEQLQQLALCCVWLRTCFELRTGNADELVAESNERRGREFSRKIQPCPGRAGQPASLGHNDFARQDPDAMSHDIRPPNPWKVGRLAEVDFRVLIDPRWEPEAVQMGCRAV
ncbi:hypothetical protein GCM10028789_21800 [Sinomonas halotolerans]